jgi:hypothetical protein
LVGPPEDLAFGERRQSAEITDATLDGEQSPQARPSGETAPPLSKRLREETPRQLAGAG